MERGRRVHGLALGSAVFLSGAALLGVEIAASRVLAPTFGSSLYVWGALIGVVLTGLSIGYWAGGALADRWPSPYLFVSAIALGAGLVLAIPLVDEWVLEQVVAWDAGPRLDPLVASVILFGPMSVVLASVSPIAVRLAARSIDRLGRTAGRLFAISTAGSIAGTFATSFWLVPEYGTDQVLAVGRGRAARCGRGRCAAAAPLGSRRGARRRSRGGAPRRRRVRPGHHRARAGGRLGAELVAALPRARRPYTSQARSRRGRARRYGLHRPRGTRHALPPPPRRGRRELALPALRQLVPERDVPRRPGADAVRLQRLPPSRSRVQPEREEDPRNRARRGLDAKAALPRLRRRRSHDRRDRPGRRRGGVQVVRAAAQPTTPGRGRRRPPVSPANRRTLRRDHDGRLLFRRRARST